MMKPNIGRSLQMILEREGYSVSRVSFGRRVPQLILGASMRICWM